MIMFRLQTLIYTSQGTVYVMGCKT